MNRFWPFLLLVVLCCSAAHAQHMTIQEHACVKLSGDAVLRLSGNLQAAGMYLSDPASKTVADADEARYFSGNIRLGLFTKDGQGVLSLQTGLSLDALLHLVGGSIATENVALTLGEDARLVDEAPSKYLIGHGAAVRSVGTGASDFGGLGCAVLAGTDDLGVVSLHRYAGPGSAVTAGSSVGINRQWWLQAESAPSNGRELNFTWVADDDNGKDLTQLQIWKTTDGGASWYAVGSVQNAALQRTIALSSETSFGGYTVSDVQNPLSNSAPVAKCQNITVAVGMNCSAPASIDDGSYDPDNDQITLTQDPPGPYPIGNTLVTLTVTDSHDQTSSCTATVTVTGTYPAPTITVSPSPTVTGLDANTIYLGYGQEYVTLSATGGTSYSWSPTTDLSCSSCSSPTFSPTAAGTYTFTVTVLDGNGCSGSASVTITVLDWRCGNNQNKVTVCHNGNTLCVAQQAVQALLNKGATLGGCQMPKSDGTELRDPIFTVNYPNPFHPRTSILFILPVESQVSLRVYDMFGRELCRLLDEPRPAGVHTVEFDAHGLRSGTYIYRLDVAGQQIIRTMTLLR
jgi:hypothetical protein